MNKKILAAITSIELKRKSIDLVVKIYRNNLIGAENIQKQGINASIGSVISAFLLLLICLLSYTKYQTENIFIDHLCMAITIITLYLLCFTVLMSVWHGYVYITGSRSNETGINDMSKVIAVVIATPLFPLFMLCTIIYFVKLNSNVPRLDLAIHLLSSQIDEEQKGLLYDEAAEMKKIGLSSQQVKMKQLISILSLYWAKLIIWYNHEIKRTKV
jgi:hypothetical protein